MSTTLSSNVGPTDISPTWFMSPPVADGDVALPAWYTELRAQAWEEFTSLPDPVRKDEDWRFADLKKVRFADFRLAEPVENHEALVARSAASYQKDYAARFVFANNRLIDSDTSALPDGLICLPIEEAIVEHGDLVRKYLFEEAKTLGNEKFRALHRSASLSGLFVYAKSGVQMDKPIEVFHYAGGDQSAIFPHLLAISEGQSSVVIEESYESINPGESTLSIGMTHLHADEASQIQYATLQDLDDNGPKLVQLNSNRAGRDSQVKAAFVNLGAAWVRQESINRMLETGSDTRILGANLVNGIQEYDQRTLQVHEAQHTTSDLLFKNALYDEARAIFGGLIQVLPGSHHTDSYQTCRNLLGSDQAEANAMPGLEIDADQVKCSHGSTSGQISDEEIFYLRARGIPAEQARKMISIGFLNEAISKLNDPGVKEHLIARVEKKFASLG
ncbi:MAG: SufD family Fe-S cluster assembly protein [Verrucomicrobiota bacterium]